MRVVVTGGAGYIGSHTVVQLIEAGHDVVVVDNLSNSSEVSLDRVEQISGVRPLFVHADVRDESAMREVFSAHQIDAVIHFAGLKAVGESVAVPLKYYRNNLESTFVLLEVMHEFNVHQLVFSSSATVYGDPEQLPLTEDSPRHATNPYGRTKLMIEEILEDLVHSDDSWHITSLRYFNPVGAHPSGLIGEDPSGIPNNLLPYVSQVAVGKRDHVSVFGNDYDTVDGTGVRDYIHVVDLAAAHLAALAHPAPGGEYRVYNVGTGQGTSVLQLIDAFGRAAGHDVPYQIVDRRPGDVAACYADPSLAQRELEWHAMLTIDDACRDAWAWQSANPDGYRS